ncbi:MAG TPA: hypothetical protein ACN46L_03225, partial [Prochlorococcus sp.]
GMGDIELAWLQALSGVKPQVIKSTFTRKSALYFGANSKENIDHLQFDCLLGLHAQQSVCMPLKQPTSVAQVL